MLDLAGIGTPELQGQREGRDPGEGDWTGTQYEDELSRDLQLRVHAMVFWAIGIPCCWKGVLSTRFFFRRITL